MRWLMYLAVKQITEKLALQNFSSTTVANLLQVLFIHREQITCPLPDAFLDQKLISYHYTCCCYSSSCCCWGDLFKALPYQIRSG